MDGQVTIPRGERCMAAALELSLDLWPFCKLSSLESNRVIVPEADKSAFFSSPEFTEKLMIVQGLYFSAVFFLFLVQPSGVLLMDMHQTASDSMFSTESRK